MLHVLQPVATEGGFVLPGEVAARAWLADLGLRPGDRLAVGLASDPVGAALIAAAWRLGLVLVPLSARWSPDRCGELLRLARADRVVAVAGHPLAAQPSALIPPNVFADAANPLGPLPDVLTNAPALVIHTSGTTGTPKRVRLSRRAVQASGEAACERLGLSPADAWLGVLPLDHVGGIQVVLRARTAGYRLVLAERFDPDAVSTAIDQGLITGASLVPTLLHRLVAQRGGRPFPATLRTLLIGGGPLPLPLAQATAALGCAPCQTYGLSETASMTTCLSPAEARAGLGTAGPVLPGMELAIRDPAGRDLPPGQTGTIALRGPLLGDGVEGDDGMLQPMADATGWFTTGDRGSLDPAGRLTVLGRWDDVIVSGGENLDPLPIEQHLEQLSGVTGAAVVGEPDDEWGQVAVAVLEGVPCPDQTVREHLLVLPGFQRPKRWRWVAALPRTALGKLQRTVLRT